MVYLGHWQQKHTFFWDYSDRCPTNPARSWSQGTTSHPCTSMSNPFISSSHVQVPVSTTSHYCSGVKFSSVELLWGKKRFCAAQSLKQAECSCPGQSHTDDSQEQKAALDSVRPSLNMTPQTPVMGDPNGGTSAILVMLRPCFWAGKSPAGLQEFSQSSRKGGGIWES